jgi:carbamate kinase
VDADVVAVLDELVAHLLLEVVAGGAELRQPVEDVLHQVEPVQAVRVVETRLIHQLLDSGAVVICAGGGGAPVVRNRLGELEGIEAVVDKDSTTGLLAATLDADLLVLLTDVAAVQTGYGTPSARAILRATPAELRALKLPAGSMGPKVEAVCRFVELTGGTAAIGALHDVDDILTGKAGTIVTPSGTYP